MKEFYAHSIEGKPAEEWHWLEEHEGPAFTDNVMVSLSNHASEFGCGEWGSLAGLWHDLGKYSEDFQKMLLASVDAHIETKPGRVDHSTAGARVK